MYIVWPTLSSLNNLKLHKTQAMNFKILCLLPVRLLKNYIKPCSRGINSPYNRLMP